MSSTTDLVLPKAGKNSLRQLLSTAVQHAMGVAVALGSLPDSTPITRAFHLHVARALRAEPGLFASSMRMPSRLVLARCLALSGGSSDERKGWANELAASLALDAARAGVIEGSVEIEGAPRRLIDERAGLAFHTAASSRWVLDRAGATIATGDRETRISWSASELETRRALENIGGTCARSHVPIFADASLLLEDNNPLAELEAHPGKSGNKLDLGGHPAEEWARALASAFTVIEDALPEIAAEMRLLLRHVGPVGFHDDVHLSASYVEATGVVYLSLHPNELTLVEALVHEFQHNKLNLLFAEDRVLENADHPLFTSPVRPDPRPLRGVLLAVHAFQPLVVLYERLVARGGDRTRQLTERLRQIAKTCHEGCEVLLPNAQPTLRGAPLLREIAALDRAFSVHLGEPVGGA